METWVHRIDRETNEGKSWLELDKAVAVIHQELGDAPDWREMLVSGGGIGIGRFIYYVPRAETPPPKPDPSAPYDRNLQIEQQLRAGIERVINREAGLQWLRAWYQNAVAPRAAKPPLPAHFINLHAPRRDNNQASRLQRVRVASEGSATGGRQMIEVTRDELQSLVELAEEALESRGIRRDSLRCVTEDDREFMLWAWRTLGKPIPPYFHEALGWQPPPPNPDNWGMKQWRPRPNTKKHKPQVTRVRDIGVWSVSVWVIVILSALLSIVWILMLQ